MIGQSFKLAAVIFAVSFFSFQNHAEARRRGGGIFFITTGETTSDYHNVTAEDVKFLSPSLEPNSVSPSFKVSYKYSRFGLFWINLWTWGGEICYMDHANNAYYNIDISQEEAIKKYGKPFFYKFPPLLMAAILGGGIWLFVTINATKESRRVPASKPSPGLNPGTVPVGGNAPPKPVQAKKEFTAEELQTMYDDPIYQHALELLEQTDSFIKPVEYLIENGVPEAEAGQNLAELKKAIAESQA